MTQISNMKVIGLMVDYKKSSNFGIYVLSSMVCGKKLPLTTEPNT